MGGDLGEKPWTTSSTRNLNVFLLSVILGLCLYIFETRQSGSSGSHECLRSYGAYHGHVYSNTASGTAGPARCLIESKWMKVQQHTVRLPGTDKLIDDWLWIDYHDRINVLVEAPRKVTDREPQFLIFEQSKYALEGRMSKAIIGGIIEPGEEPETAAAREVKEEMGMTCQKLHFLGRFRTDVNRGMGWVNSFLAMQCKEAKKAGNDKTEKEEEVGVADTEKQKLKTIGLRELRRAATAGEFLEVQWSATVAMALLHPELGQ
ncbi:expressed unknown protein [Seminavis robusta]|uniref:Nudix hydrolase domain-containing protein n=1 Tax=Seminavis robusta TaxID=568900 RepID=A0A9N8HYU1_9STRA|nr:expressed unknown protein [Seminavis robusta]|eukprot:Sro2643_g333490.1 n/a (262) ;mRNA; r:2728-3513